MSDGELRKLFRQNLPHIHWTTIESRYTQAGIPDLNGCQYGIEFWLECKATKTWKVVLRPMQISWILRRIRAGGTCWLAVRRQSKTVDQLWLVPGSNVRALARLGLCASLARYWQGGPRAWPWQAIGQALAVPAGVVKFTTRGKGRAAVKRRIGKPAKGSKGQKAALA